VPEERKVHKIKEGRKKQGRSSTTAPSVSEQDGTQRRKVSKEGQK